MAFNTADTASGLTPARLQITGAIRSASTATGTSFEYLLAAAKIESNLNPSASASTSSAKGLYQFIEQTWLGTVKEAGGALGYGNYADAITRTASGRYTVSDPVTKQAILKLRDDPVASAAMAGVLTRSNGIKVAQAIGREPTNGELYIAHFLGAGGASKLIVNAEQSPQTKAAALFPSAAAANRSIFYDRGGRARSVGEVYGVLTSRYAAAANAPSTLTAMAMMPTSATQTAATKTAASVTADARAGFLTAFPQAAQAATTSTASAPNGAPLVLASAAPESAGFRALFQGGDRAEPVAPAVQQLWDTGSASQARRESGGFDLFSDRAGRFAG